MARFTEDNTEGFTAHELAEMNRALDIIGDDEDNAASDFINNHFVPGVTADELVSWYNLRRRG